MANTDPDAITGRCYCGATTLRSTSMPHAVAYCHCQDCRRVTGAPVAAFAAFAVDAVVFQPNMGKSISVTPGVTRTFCDHCGTSLAGFYDYLPGQVFISLGVIDQADNLPPQVHAHAGERLSWLHIDDDLERPAATAAAFLQTP
ncbi:hypothetical protein LA6_001088 [Marinibacterium anthonyi]|nr:hypothetical protein LA6_001088 [Marinibacterium anthonyi]